MTALVAMIVACMIADPVVASDNEIPIAAPIDTEAAGRGAENAIPSVVKVICQDSGVGGTGFLHKSGKIITASHVVSDCRQVKVVSAGSGTQLLAKIDAQDRELDLAILSTTFPFSHAYIPISDESPIKIGTQVTTWGFPGGYVGGAPLLSVGYLSGIQAFKESPSARTVQRYVVNAAFNSGNSGGPLLNLETGKIIGVVTSKLAPIPKHVIDILKTLETQKSGMQYRMADGKGGNVVASEAHLVWNVLHALRAQVQLVIGYAVSTRDLRSFLQANGVEP